MASFSSLIFMSMLCTAWAAQNFQSVSVCPRNDVNWKAESLKKNCQGDTPDYLCAAIENQPNKYGQICTKYGLTPAKKCAVLNEQTYNLDSVDCKADSGCPQDPYIPSDLWKYQICYGDFYGTTTMAAGITTKKTINETTGSASSLGDSGSGDGSKVGVVVAVVIILILLIIGVGILVVFYRTNQFGFKGKVDQLIQDFHKWYQERSTEGPQDVEKGEQVEPGQAQPLIPQEPVYAKPDKNKTKKDKDDTKQKIKKLNELQKYLVHILKQELGVNDLKEKAVIHSKSINEHFSEPLRKDLQSVKDLNDYYNKLDMCLVLALLRNFCEGIKPPSRGWDYEPPDDEIHVGADIERIRSMWNKYCDDDLQFKYLDDVYNRMKQKYGTVAVHGDDGEGKSPSKDEENTEGFEKVKEKIQSVKLNKDCIVEKGIVITENITTALKIFTSRSVVILKGVIGCGKTHALKAIQNHFQDKNVETAWVEPENILMKISESKEKPTILLCDNLFGRFGSSVFSQNAVDQIEEVLKKNERSEQTKVAIGIHTHVYDEVKKTLKLNFLHQKNITVEMDNLSEAEALLIFKEQLTKGHCKMDPNCWFKPVGFQSVLDKLSKNQGHIGGPFLSLMYCNQHELFSDEAFSVNPIQTLVQHIQKMRDNSPKLYNCLIYLMCVQQHNLEEQPEKWAGHISAEITKHNLMDLAKTSCLLHVDNKIATLAHDLLTTVLFKCAAEQTEIFSPVLQLCQSDVFLQLLRPTSSTNSDFYFEYLPDSKNRDVGRMCTYRLARMDKKQEINHPLMEVELVKEKYAKYSIHSPKGLAVINIPEK